jgi:hypothetical protein
VRKTLLLPVLAVAAAVLAAVSPAAAAAGPAKPAPGAAAASPGVATFIKSFVDTRRVNNSAFGHDVSPTSDGGYVVAGAGGLPGSGWVAKLSAAGQVQFQEQLGSGEA